MSKHPKRLRNAGISQERYEELQRVCRQYGEYKRTLRLLRAGIADRPRRSSGAWHPPDPTGSAAVSLASHPYARRVRIIEQCAQRAAGETLAGAVLKNVAEGQRYEHIRPRPPCGSVQFYRARLDFFIALDDAMWREETGTKA